MQALIALPNLLTYARIPLAGVIWIAPTHTVFFFTVMGLAGLTDVLDGMFARRIRDWRLEQGDDPDEVEETARAGAWLDPFCDKVFFTSALIAVALRSDAPLWIALLIGTRELLYTPFALVYHLSSSLRSRIRYDFTAGWPGKATTVLQFAALSAVVLEHSLTLTLAIAAAGMGTIAAGYYLLRAWRVIHRDEDP